MSVLLLEQDALARNRRSRADHGQSGSYPLSVARFEAVGITRRNSRYTCCTGSEQKANMLFCRHEWVAGIAQGFNVVKVSVADVRVEHEVRLMDFTKWLERAGGSPREVSDRQKIRAILGMPTPR